MKRNTVFSLAMAWIVVFVVMFAAGAMVADNANAGDAQTIQGMVEKGEKGITVIKTDEGQTYTILGKNMSQMVGKTVKVTGTLTKGGENRSVVVSSFEEIKK